MFKETFILFLLFFIFSTYIKNAKSFTPQEIIKIKKKVFEVSPSINKTRSKKLIIKREFQEAKLVFDAIKKQKWSKAKKIANQDTTLIKLIDWYFLNQNKNPKFFQKTNEFIIRNPDWPKKEFLRKKNEMFIGSKWNNNKIINYFDLYPPLTTKGAVNYVDALRKKNGINNVKNLASEIWIERNFSKTQSKDFYKKYKKILTPNDHLKRIDRLTWVGRSYEARRMLPIINKNYRNLYSAKIVLRRREGNADSVVSRVPRNLKKNEGLIFERLRWRRKTRLYDTAFELIDPLPNNLKYEKKWWYETSILIRKFIERKKYQKAYKLAKDFSGKSTKYTSESEWLAGWIGYNFLNLKSEIYINHFLNSYENTNHRGEKAKSAYWAGKSYKKIGNEEQSKIWFETAAKEVTEFYGQLSFDQIKKNNVTLIENQELYGKSLITKEDLKLMETSLYKATEIVLLYSNRNTAKKFFSALLEFCKKPGEFQLVARLGENSRRVDLAIKASNKSFEKDINLYHFGYPTISYKLASGLEKELVYAVIRQESIFDEKAHSRAGARGLMQLMPATAKKVSKKINLKYSKSSLKTNPQYNVALGSFYLKSLIENYNGSYLLALVGYNAGPRNAGKWIKKFGDPRKKNVDPISWIEQIPIKETRLYVKKVLSNLQVYRQKNQRSKNKKIISRKNSI